jgi:hypothetical protein
MRISFIFRPDMSITQQTGTGTVEPCSHKNLSYQCQSPSLLEHTKSSRNGVSRRIPYIPLTWRSFLAELLNVPSFSDWLVESYWTVAQLNNRSMKASSSSVPLRLLISASWRQSTMSSSDFQFGGWPQGQSDGQASWNRGYQPSKINWYGLMT